MTAARVVHGHMESWTSNCRNTEWYTCHAHESFLSLTRRCDALLASSADSAAPSANACLPVWRPSSPATARPPRGGEGESRESLASPASQFENEMGGTALLGRDPAAASAILATEGSARRDCAADDAPDKVAFTCCSPVGAAAAAAAAAACRCPGRVPRKQEQPIALYVRINKPLLH